jgi:hypothetical protein
MWFVDELRSVSVDCGSIQVNVTPCCSSCVYFHAYEMRGPDAEMPVKLCMKTAQAASPVSRNNARVRHWTPQATKLAILVKDAFPGCADYRGIVGSNGNTPLESILLMATSRLFNSADCDAVLTTLTDQMILSYRCNVCMHQEVPESGLTLPVETVAVLHLPQEEDETR